MAVEDWAGKKGRQGELLVCKMNKDFLKKKKERKKKEKLLHTKGFPYLNPKRSRSLDAWGSEQFLMKSTGKNYSS